ncbi:hypothetical protein [Micromonospora haikouensis]|uniref:hypothetical protein n=1 Tax=Micromonospora haikouensis TaxID=686309 RepID=UPI003D74EB16
MLIAAGQRITAALLRGIYGTDWDDWTSTIGGGGSAVTTSTGRWRRIGEKTVAFTLNISVTTAGSGGSTVTWTLPTAPSRTRRWVFVGAAESGAALSGLHAVTFTGGSGAVVDRVRYGGATNLTGADLTLNKLLQFSGIYEEA